MKWTHVRLLVDDYSACYAFYRDVLGFRPTFDGANSAYAEFDTGEITFSLYKRDMMDAAIGAPHQAARGEDRVLLWLSVENVDQTAAALQAQGVKLTAPPTDRPQWGLRTAHFRDPDGNLIEIGHSIPMSDG